MRLGKIRLRNWRQYRDKEFVFHDGITGIFGRNGAGKSNLLQAAYFSLTGDVGGDSPKQRSICRMAKDGEDSYVQADWTHENTEFSIRRFLKPNKQELKIVGEEKSYSSAAEIADKIQAITGRSMSFIDNHVFVAQWRMFDFLLSTPAARAKSIAELCDVSGLEQLWEQLQTQWAEDVRLLSIPTEDITELESRQAMLRQREKTSLDIIKQQTAKIIEPEKVAGYKQAIANWEKLQTVLDQQAYLEESLTNNALDYKESKKQLAKTTAALAVKRAAVTDIVSQTNSLTAKRSDLSTQLSAAEKQLEAIKAHDATKALLAGRKLEDLSKLKAELDAVQAKVQEITAARRVARQAMEDMLADPGSGICPKCRTKVDAKHLQEERDELSKTFNKLTDQFKEATDARSLVSDVYEAAAQKNTEIQTLTNRLQIQERIMGTTHTDAKIVAKRLESIKLEIAELDRKKTAGPTELRTLRSEIAALETEERTLVSSVAAYEAWEKELQEQDFDSKIAELSKPALGRPRIDSTEAYEKAKELLAEQRSLNDTVQSENKYLTDTRHDLKVVANSIKRSKSMNETRETAQVWLDDLQAWRNVVHRNNLPKILTTNFFRELVIDINNQLDLLEAPFRVTAADDLAFNVVRQNGTIDVVGELSGAEKVILAMAYRLSVNKSELLVLDEPTAGLDDIKLAALATTLQKMAAISQAQGRQIIIVTHDERLAPVFSQVIDLGTN